MSKKDSSHSSRMLKILPPILTVALVLLCIYIGSRMSIQGLISYTPSNVLLAAAGILALFAVKSLSVIFPLSVLYIVSAFWFGKWVGLAVCYLGLVVSCTIPYLLGRHFGAGMVEQLLCKYPKLRQLQSVGDSNQLMFSYRTSGTLYGICVLGRICNCPATCAVSFWEPARWITAAT